MRQARVPVHVQKREAWGRRDGRDELGGAPGDGLGEKPGLAAATGGEVEEEGVAGGVAVVDRV